MSKSSPSSVKENEAIQAKYLEYVRQHGEFFSDTIEPLTAEDIADLERRRKRVKIIWYVLSAIAIALALADLIFSPVQNFTGIFEMLLVLVIVIGGGALLVRNFGKALDGKQKRVVKGVITSKTREHAKGSDGKSYFLQVSGKEKIKVSSSDYRKCQMGEMISIERPSEDSLIKSKFTRLGKI